MKKTLSLTGITLHIIYFILYFLAVFYSQTADTGNRSWQFMIFSLIVVIFCEIAYTIDAVYGIIKEGTGFNVIKLIAVIIGAVVIYCFAYHGAVKTVICSMYMFALLILELVSFIKEFNS